MLRRYWFEFHKDLNSEEYMQRYGYLPAGPGIGVTAYSREDAILLIRRWVAKDGKELPEITKCIENVDVSTLFPSGTPFGIGLGCPVWRGLWFPPYNLWFGRDGEP